MKTPQTPAGAQTAAGAWGALWKMSLEQNAVQPGGSCARRSFNVLSQCPFCVCVPLVLCVLLKLFVSIFTEIHLFSCLHIFVLPSRYNREELSTYCACASVCTNGTVATIRHICFWLESLLSRGKVLCMCSHLRLTHQAVPLWQTVVTVQAVFSFSCLSSCQQDDTVAD